jgi:hypothetical protein
MVRVMVEMMVMVWCDGDVMVMVVLVMMVM